MYLQITARIDPVKAIHTTDTAEGTRAAYSPKCSLANKKPKALDFIEVSIAMVRQATSPNPNTRGRPYPTKPPIKWSKKTGHWSISPALRIGPATCATALATKRHVETTPTTGANGRMVLTNLGKKWLADIPMAMGAKTTLDKSWYEWGKGQSAWVGRQQQHHERCRWLPEGWTPQYRQHQQEQLFQEWLCKSMECKQ